MTNKKCFIIMPVSTPPELVSDYNDDSEHFLNVMEQLFIPAIKEAGFEPIRPITKGSDIIHGHIISNLESSDLVLCDMSTKNPNVFFEFGIRTALNKPICLVKDNLLKKVPFDTASNNYHEYSSDIRKWFFERERLVKHIMDSFNESDNCNSLWKYFGNKTQSKETINQSKETIEQSKKEQQIRDIENRLEKFYIPADNIMKFTSEFIKNPKRGTKFHEIIKYKSPYATMETTYEEYAVMYTIGKLKEIEQYRFLASKETCRLFMKFAYEEDSNENRLELSKSIEIDIKDHLTKLYELKK